MMISKKLEFVLRVRNRAYALWENDGMPDDPNDEYWDRALAEIKAEKASMMKIIRSERSKRTPKEPQES